LSVNGRAKPMEFDVTSPHQDFAYNHSRELSVISYNLIMLQVKTALPQDHV
jgi:hypothetical protein